MRTVKLGFDLEAENPALAEAISDITEIHALLDDLVVLRRAMGKTQKSVAAQMGVSQSTVAGFESEMSNPTLSTLQRYARAIGVRVRFKVEGPHPIRSMDVASRNEMSWSESQSNQTGYIWAAAK